VRGGAAQDSTASQPLRLAATVQLTAESLFQLRRPDSHHGPWGPETTTRQAVAA
jgi:hypothetical protein